MKIIYILQIIISILLVLSVLLTNQGTTLGGAFGGGDTQVWRSRRGPEKFLFISTIVLGILFVGLAVLNLVL